MIGFFFWIRYGNNGVFSLDLITRQCPIGYSLESLSKFWMLVPYMTVAMESATLNQNLHQILRFPVRFFISQAAIRRRKGWEIEIILKYSVSFSRLFSFQNAEDMYGSKKKEKSVQFVNINEQRNSHGNWRKFTSNFAWSVVNYETLHMGWRRWKCATVDLRYFTHNREFFLSAVFRTKNSK